MKLLGTRMKLQNKSRFKYQKLGNKNKKANGFLSSKKSIWFWGVGAAFHLAALDLILTIHENYFLCYRDFQDSSQSFESFRLRRNRTLKYLAVI